MRVLRHIRDNPILVLTVAVVGLITWVAADLLIPPSPKEVSILPDSLQFSPPPRLLPGPGAMADAPEGIALAQMTAQRNLPVQAAVLPKLKAGMTRLEVEEILGPPIPDRIQPVTASEGRLTYLTAYELADPGPPMTVRPITPSSRRPASTPLSYLALEYDASRPGHPLLEVLYPDPLF
jgi:hypothetical protein